MFMESFVYSSVKWLATDLSSPFPLGAIIFAQLAWAPNDNIFCLQQSDYLSINIALTQL